MLSLFLARSVAVSPIINRYGSYSFQSPTSRFNHKSSFRLRSMASESDPSSFAQSFDSNSAETNPSGFCIIEGSETVQDFAKMELQEIQDNIRSRRNKIFLHMEEVRRLRIQQRIKNTELGMSTEEPENELPNFPSFIPFLPPLTSANLKQYYAVCFSLIAGIILFGGLLAPALELKLGIGGTSYEDFISSMHLPMQLSEVDPIVASFSGGAVGVISALMVVEINNVKLQEHNIVLELDILLVLGVQAQEPLCLLKQFQPLMVEISLYHYQKPKDVQTAQELERLCALHVFALGWPWLASMTLESIPLINIIPQYPLSLHTSYKLQPFSWCRTYVLELLQYVYTNGSVL